MNVNKLDLYTAIVVTIIVIILVFMIISTQLRVGTNQGYEATGKSKWDVLHPAASS